MRTQNALDAQSFPGYREHMPSKNHAAKKIAKKITNGKLGSKAQNITLPPKTRQMLIDHAKEEELSISGMVAMLVRDWERRKRSIQSLPDVDGTATAKAN